jgi:hypothetical protein
MKWINSINTKYQCSKLFIRTIFLDKEQLRQLSSNFEKGPRVRVALQSKRLNKQV